jgi:hypothetical protein
MAERGAPEGNQNAKGRLFNSALKRAVVQDDGKRLRATAEKLLDLAAAGEAWAVRELADRLDGKAAQGIQLTGEDEGPIKLVFGWAKD